MIITVMTGSNPQMGRESHWIVRIRKTEAEKGGPMRWTNAVIRGRSSPGAIISEEEARSPLISRTMYQDRRPENMERPASIYRDRRPEIYGTACREIGGKYAEDYYEEHQRSQ